MTKKVKRTYELEENVYTMLQQLASDERRSVNREIETLIVKAYTERYIGKVEEKPR